MNTGYDCKNGGACDYFGRCKCPPGYTEVDCGLDTGKMEARENMDVTVEYHPIKINIFFHFNYHNIESLARTHFFCSKVNRFCRTGFFLLNVFIFGSILMYHLKRKKDVTIAKSVFKFSYKIAKTIY